MLASILRRSSQVIRAEVKQERLHSDRAPPDEERCPDANVPPSTGEVERLPEDEHKGDEERGEHRADPLQRPRGILIYPAAEQRDQEDRNQSDEQKTAQCADDACRDRIQQTEECHRSLLHACRMHAHITAVKGKAIQKAMRMNS